VLKKTAEMICVDKMALVSRTKKEIRWYSENGIIDFLEPFVMPWRPYIPPLIF